MDIDYGPALRGKSRHYPARWNGRTPKTIRMLRTVHPDMPFSKCAPALAGQEYPAWTNSNGAVCTIFPDGEHLGVKPHEFEVVEWFEADGVTVTREPEAQPGAWTPGTMTLERAREINAALVSTAMVHVVGGARPPLPRCSLEEMLIATRIVGENRETPNPDGTKTIHVNCDPRIVAAMYAFEKFDCDPRTLLEALGFSATVSEDDGEGDEEGDQ